MLLTDLDYFKIANKITKYLDFDSPENCLDPDWFQKYPVQDYDYRFNSWGFRGPEYEKYLGYPVNLCLGCDFTVNVGGPIDHSWPSLLQEQFNIPCLNLGIVNGGNDTIRIVYERACKLFDVQNTFVVYSWFRRRLTTTRFESLFEELHENNMVYFEKQFIQDAYYNFIPPYCLSKEELDYVGNMSEFYIDPTLVYWNNNIPRQHCSRRRYNELKGEEWPTYDEFIAGVEPHPDVYTDQFRLSCLTYNNRDGHHLSLEANQKLADNLYNQTK